MAGSENVKSAFMYVTEDEAEDEAEDHDNEDSDDRSVAARQIPNTSPLHRNKKSTEPLLSSLTFIHSLIRSSSKQLSIPTTRRKQVNISSQPLNAAPSSKKISLAIT